MDITSQEGLHYLQAGRTRTEYTRMHWDSHLYRKAASSKALSTKTVANSLSKRDNLTILIPTLPERQTVIAPLLAELQRQGAIINTSHDVSISTGEKRNQLLQTVETDYCCFVDDDDWIHPDFIKILTSTLHKNPGIDALGFDVLYLQDQLPPRLIQLASPHPNWHLRGPVLRRPIMPWCVLKKDIAQRTAFPNCHWGEDRVWADRLSKEILSCIRIPVPLYFYEFLPDDSKTNKNEYVSQFYKQFPEYLQAKPAFSHLTASDF